MILILSSYDDSTTHEVILYLLFKEKYVVRINGNEKISTYISDEIFNVIKSQRCTFSIDDVESYWYRRGEFNFTSEILVRTFLENSAKISDRKESLEVSEFLLRLLNNKPKVGDYFNTDLNKLFVSHIAKLIGLSRPSYVLTHSKNDMLVFQNAYKGKTITKALSKEKIFFDNESQMMYYIYTERVKESILKNIEPKISLSYIEQEINKKYELRIFYLKGEFYTMAIFSQQNEQTAVDFRKYDDKKPNRNVPYQLPKEIENKLEKLMNTLNLDTGSIDMIVDTTGSYYFLEVNPIGQFGMVSYPCNYFLEKKIANLLINISKNQ